DRGRATVRLPPHRSAGARQGTSRTPLAGHVLPLRSRRGPRLGALRRPRRHRPGAPARRRGVRDARRRPRGHDREGRRPAVPALRLARRDESRRDGDPDPGLARLRFRAVATTSYLLEAAGGPVAAAAFDDDDAAVSAVTTLRDSGVREQDISVIAADPRRAALVAGDRAWLPGKGWNG